MISVLKLQDCSIVCVQLNNMQRVQRTSSTQRERSGSMLKLAVRELLDKQRINLEMNTCVNMTNGVIIFATIAQIDNMDLLSKTPWRHRVELAETISAGCIFAGRSMSFLLISTWLMTRRPT